MEYVPIGATQKTDQRTSRMVELFISEGLKLTGEKTRQKSIKAFDF